MSQGGANNTSGSGASPIETLTGNSGGSVSPDGAFNIDVFGNNATGIDIVGTPASNLLTVIGLDASETQQGTVELATGAETTTGTSTSLAVHPSGLDTKLGTQTSNGLMYGQGGAGTNLASLAEATNGQIPIGSTGNPPVLALPTSSDSSITISGGAGTLDFVIGSAVSDSFPTDSGTAVPSSGALTVSGGTGISTSGAASTVTVTLDAPVTVANGGTGSTSYTAGSVVFSNGSILTEDNSNLFWDDTSNSLGIGVNTLTDNFEVAGTALFTHTATSNGDHALEIDCNASGFGDVKCLDIVYETGAITTGEEEEAILVNVDESASTGGEVFGIEILSTAEGSANVYGTKHGVNVNPILQNSGTFGNADTILVLAVDQTAALSSGGAGNVTVFSNDNDTMTIGDAAQFAEIEFIVDTPASGAGVAPTFEFSTGVGTWSSFSPTDGTNGFRNSGIVDWDLPDIPTWATGTGGEYLIRITRTRNSLSTVPILDLVQIAATTVFQWDKSGDLDVNSLTLASALTVANGGTGATTLTDHGILLGSGTAAITPTAAPTDGQLLIGSTGVDPVLGSLTSSGSSITVTGGAGTLNIDIAAPVSVANGGTGATTLTDHGVLVGSGTGAITPLAVGTTGQLLVGASGSDPAFASSANANFSFTSSTAGSPRVLTVTNTDNTNTGSHANLLAESGGASGGDPFVRMSVSGAQDYSFGVDNSDSDALKINDDADPSTGNNLWRMSSAGERTLPLQPRFTAYVSSTITNVTGDGTAYTVVFDTEDQDVGSDYNNSTGVFTAPVAGTYIFTSTAVVSGLTGSHTSGQWYIAVGGGKTRNYRFAQADFGAVATSGNDYSAGGSCIVNLSASDTASVVVQINSGGLVVDLVGGAPGYSTFTGALLC